MGNKYAFYRPHKKVTFGNELVDPFTGEISYPPSMTKQAHLKECDINNILKQFKVTGIVKHISAHQPMYADLPDGMDFQLANQLVIDARVAFDTLPAKVRDRFGHDPQSFLTWLADPANKTEATELGLFNPPPPSEPVDQVPPAPQTTP